MTYTRNSPWVDNTTAITAAKMTNIEDGIEAGLSRSSALPAATNTCRPTTFVETYRVTGGTTSVVLGTYATVAAAFAQIVTDQRAAITGAAADSSRLASTMWRQVIVNSGDYNEQALQMPNFTSLVSATDDWRDVRIYGAGDITSGAIINTTGATCHISGIEFDFTGTDNEWHPWRDGGIGGNADDLGGRGRRTIIVERSKFITSNTLAGRGACCLDSTFGAGAFVLVMNCIFQQDDGVQVINLVTNTATSGPPSQFVFIDNTVRLMYLERQIGANDPANPVGLIDFGGQRKDRVYWMGGTFDIGVATGYGGVTSPGTDGAVTVEYQPSVGSPVQTTQFYIDPNLPTTYYNGTKTFLLGSVAWNAGVLTANQFRTYDLPRMPVDGISPIQADALGLTSQSARLFDEDANYMRPNIASTRAALTANRIYYVRMPAEKAFEVGRAVIGTSGAKGVAHAVAIYADDGTGTAPDASSANLRVTYSVLTPANNADRVVVGEASNRRPFYPLHGYLWVAFVTASATPTYDTATSQTDYLVKYQDGWAGATLGAPSGLATLPGGTAYPLVTLQHYEFLTSAMLSSTGGTINYTVPPSAKALDITLIAGGGGGGSGRRGLAGTARCGGGGGSGGAVTRAVIPTHLLSPTIVFFFTGTGAGGAARTTDDTDGAAGSAGTTIIARTGLTPVEYMRANGGNGGAAGTAAAAAGGTGQSGGMGLSGAGGGSAAAGAGVGPAAHPGSVGAPGGGGGGTVTTANAATAGGNGANSQGVTNTSGSGGAATGVAGGAGTDALHGAGTGAGGGGGGAAAAAAGGAGGAGGSYGGGGGGGAGSANTFNSGAGGNGGPAVAIVVPLY